MFYKTKLWKNSEKNYDDEWKANFLDFFIIYIFFFFDDKINAKIIENERENPLFIMNKMNNEDIILDYIWFNYLYNNNCLMNNNFNKDRESCVFIFFVKWFIEKKSKNKWEILNTSNGWFLWLY